MTAKELRENRANLLSQCRALVDAADKETRAMSAEENEQYDRLWAEAEKTKDEIERRERLEAEERVLGQATEMMADANEHSGQPRAEQANVAMQAARRFLLNGLGHLTAVERRALQADNDEAGGYVTMPQLFIDRLIKAVDNVTFIRQWATVIPLREAQSLGVPSLDADPADADWTSELGTGDEDTTMDFGKRELSPKPLAKRIKVSRKLLRLTASIENLVADRLGYKFGVSAEKAYLTGSGANRPLGVFTASNDGVSTGRDVSTGNTATSMQTDGLKEAKYTLKSPYWSRARWLFHRDGIKQIAKLQDDEGRYLWAESIRVGEPDTLMGLPIFASEYAPNTFATGQYVGILGDFSYYWIAEASNFEIQRLDELYAATNQVGYIGRMELDGMPVLEEAFVRVKLA